MPTYCGTKSSTFQSTHNHTDFILYLQLIFSSLYCLSSMAVTYRVALSGKIIPPGACDFEQDSEYGKHSVLSKPSRNLQMFD